MTPILWGRASSVNVQKVMWVLAECDIPHEQIPAGGKYGHTDTPEFEAMNPLRRVPVWQEDGLTLWESHAILRHLARGPAASLWPEGRADQALADQWIEFASSTLMPPLIGVFFQTVRFRPEERSAEALEKHLRALDAALVILEAQLAHGPWLVGDRISMADVAIGVAMYRYHTMDIPRPDRPTLTDWYARLGARPAYASTVMTSYEELRAV